MRIRLYGRTDPGRRRSTNEDAFVVSEAEGYCVLADGMGGHTAGEIASTMAVDLLGERLKRATPPRTKKRPPREEREKLRVSLPKEVLDALRAANRAIYERGHRESARLARRGATASPERRMGTTVALLWIPDDFAIAAHVGDTRIYRLRRGELERLTVDHSVYSERFPSEEKEKAAPGKTRKYVTRALGTKLDVDPEIRLHDVRAGDRYVLCTDGLTDLVDDEEIAAAIIEAEAPRGSGLAKLPVRLVALANERGGKDNVTVVVAAVDPDLSDEDTGLITRPTLTDSRSGKPRKQSRG